MTEMGFKSVGGHNFSNGTFNVGPNNGHDALHVRLENGERNQFIWLHCDPNGTWEAKDPTQQVIASGDFMTCVESVKDVNVEFRHDDMGGNFHK